MGTKRDPGEFDCYAKLADDEPFFVLRAKDPIAPMLVLVWRFLRAGDFRRAVIALEQAQTEWDRHVDSGHRTPLPLNSAKSTEAWGCSLEMRKWFDEYTDGERPAWPGKWEN